MTLNKFLSVLLGLSLIVMMSCSSDDNPTEPVPTVKEFDQLAEAGDAYFTSYVNIAGHGVNTSMSAVFDLLTDADVGNDPFIIDWRSADDFAAKHISGAVNISLGQLVAKVEDGTIPNNKTIVNVCYTGQTASIATATLNLMGFDAQNLKYGMCGVTNNVTIVTKTDRWDAAVASDEYTLNKVAVSDPTVVFDFPTISTGKSSVVDIIKGQFANVTAGWGVSFSDLITNKEDYFIINYWPKAEYDDPGHIEGAYQYTPKVDFNMDQKLKYLPTNKKIAVYCYTGQTSAQVTAYLRLLGYDAYSVLYGVNGMAYGEMVGGKYLPQVPDDAFVSVLE